MLQLTQRRLAARLLLSLLLSLGLGGRFLPAQQTAEPDQSHARYALQRSDVLLLTFPLSPEVNQTVTIQPDGYISLQNGGSVYALGLTLPALTSEIKKAYDGILNNPIVNIDLTDFVKPFFVVSGQVGKPGQYDLRSDITVSEALAVAGGMTMMTAKTQVFLFHRASENWYEVKQVNLKDALDGKKLSDDLIIRPGDMIYVPEKFIAKFRKYVPYSINPGVYYNP